MLHHVKPLIIVANDDPDMFKALQLGLEKLGSRVERTPNIRELLERLSVEEPVLVLLDAGFGERDEIHVMCELLKRRPELLVVVFAGHSPVDPVASTIKPGTFNCQKNPDDQNRVIERNGDQLVFGESLVMRQVRQLIASVASTNATVLIQGETGTGKELVARLLHKQSKRCQGPFVPVNMAALPRELAESTLFGHEKGAFTTAHRAQAGCCEAADKGTLFLDEIGEMDLPLQSKLLRFLQDHSVQRIGSNSLKKLDVRVLAATNRDLKALICEGRFREDLYYRLNVISIVVPPLRMHSEDIPILANQFLQRAANRYQKNLSGFTELAMRKLRAYAWPGNVRHLENVIERVAILCERQEIDGYDLPCELMQASSNDGIIPHVHSEGASTGTGLQGAKQLKRIECLEKEAILEVLEKTHGNVTQAAALLGLGQATMYRKIKRYGISCKDRK